MPGHRSLQGRYVTEQPATDIADSLMSNPWTAALVCDSSDRPDLYGKAAALTRAGLSAWEGPNLSPSRSAAEGEEAQVKSGQHGTEAPSSSGQHCMEPLMRPDQHYTEVQDAAFVSQHGFARPTSQHQLKAGVAACTADDSWPTQQETNPEPDAPGPDHDYTDSRKAADPLHEFPPDAVARLKTTVEPVDLNAADASMWASGQAGGTGLKQSASPAASGTTEHSNHHATALHSIVSPGTAGAQKQAATVADSPMPVWSASATLSPAAAADAAGVLTHQHQPLEQSVHGQCAQQLAGSQHAQQQHGSQHAQQQGSQKPRPGQQSKLQQRFTSWTGDYGHLDSPRFTRDRSIAWQAALQHRRDCTDEEQAMQGPDMHSVQVIMLWAASLSAYCTLWTCAVCLCIAWRMVCTHTWLWSFEKCVFGQPHVNILKIEQSASAA